jgi:hypothetical protein
MIEINYLAVLLSTIVMFILGAVWYSPLMFGNWWQEIMEVDCDKMSKEEMAKMQKEMWPAYIAQFIITFITVFMLYHYIFFWKAEANAYYVTLMLLIGFVWPTQISGILWSQTKKKYWIKQIFVSGLYQLVGLMVVAFIISLF